MTGKDFTPNEVRAARCRLATILLELARDGQLGPEQLVSTGTRLLRDPSWNIDPLARERL